MAHQPALSKESPARAAVRGFRFLNLSAPLPELGAVTIGPGVSLGGPTGCQGLHFGEGNVVPVVAMAAKQASPTAYRCLERRGQFLVGTGFAVPARNEQGQLVRPEEAGTLGDTPVPGHPGKTANDLWDQLCSYGADCNAAAVLVRYTGKEGGYAIGEVHVLPFGSVRKTVNGTYLFNHKFGKKGFRSADTTEHLPFNPDPKQVKREMTAGRKAAALAKKPYKQLGQIFYIYTARSGEEDYPLPPHWPGLDALFTEAAYQNYDLGEVRRGFMGKGILALLGEEDDQTKGADGLTEQERQDALFRRLTVAGAQEQGVEKESILVINVTSKDAIPVWVPMNTTTDLKWLTEKKEGVGTEICRHIGIPPLLCGFAKPGQLGNVQEMTNTITYTQATLEPLRQLLLRAFWRLMPTLNGLVPGKLNPVDVATAVVAAQPAKPAPAHA